MKATKPLVFKGSFNPSLSLMFTILILFAHHWTPGVLAKTHHHPVEANFSALGLPTAFQVQLN